MVRPTLEEIDEARKWWNELGNETKSLGSIWTILAMYARHWASVHAPEAVAEDRSKS